MSGYITLWTSTSDPEFKELSKYHRLEEQRLHLRMTAIEREHARRVRKVRDDIRETGSLVAQYENEKEQRARHLLKTFSKVQRKRQAAAGWRAAHWRRTSTGDVAEGETVGVGIESRRSSTFSVHLGPRGRRLSSISELTEGPGSRRASQLFGGQPRHSLANLLMASVSTFSRFRQRSTTPQAPLMTSTPRMPLPPIRRESVSTGHLRKTQSGSLSSSNDGNETTDSVFGDANDGKFINRMTSRRASRFSVTSDPGTSRSRGSESSDAVTSRSYDSESGDAVTPRLRDRDVTGYKKRDVIWTETFPFVTHSVGEIVCPRYSLFRQYEEYKVYPKRRKLKRRVSHPPKLGQTKDEAPVQEEKPPSFRSLARTLGVMQSLASRVSEVLSE